MARTEMSFHGTATLFEGSCCRHEYQEVCLLSEETRHGRVKRMLFRSARGILLFMESLSEQQLCQAHRRGLLAGPNESEMDFLERCHRSTSLNQEGVDSACQLSLNLFGFTVDWVVCRKASRQGLFAGTTQICEEKTEITLSRSVWERDRPVSRDEVVAHEWLHAARSLYDEPAFEEILAFHTSKSPLRRTISPLVQSHREVLLAVALCIVQPIAAILQVPYALWLVPALFGIWGLRLAWRQHLLRKMLRKLPVEQPLHVAVMLTDREICRFARWDVGEIQTYVQKQRGSELRWRQITAVFPDLCPE